MIYTKWTTLINCAHCNRLYAMRAKICGDIKIHCALNNFFNFIQENHPRTLRRHCRLKRASTHAGANPVGDFKIAPITRNGVSVRVKGVSNTSGSLMHGYGFVHSTGQSFPITNNNADTTTYAPIRCIQTSFENGFRNDRKLGGAFVGVL